MQSIININSLNKSFGNVTAVDGISFSVNKGEMFGLVGPDGAGKTTTMRVLCGLISRFDGEVNIFDKNIKSHKKEVQNGIGYLSQRFSLYGDLTIDENIEFFADIHNVKDYKKRRDELLRFTRLIDFRERLADHLSGGMKQKLALACSLIHKPKILFLDEPTTGVDPVSRRDFWKILSELLRDGITIVMTTPYLDEAERCHRVALMNKGKIIALDTPKKIKMNIEKEVEEIVCSPITKAYEVIRSSFDYDVQMFGDRIHVVLNNSKEEFAEIESVLNKNEIEIQNHRTLMPSLENVFIYKIKQAG